jgi:hypothetical protein
MTQDSNTLMMHRAVTPGVHRPAAALHGALAAAFHALRNQFVPVRQTALFALVMHLAQPGRVGLPVAALYRARTLARMPLGELMPFTDRVAAASWTPAAIVRALRHSWPP